MNTTTKVLLSIALIGVGVVVMLVIFGTFVARNIHVRESGPGDRRTVHVDTPFGNVTVHENSRLDPEQVGIPIYPGAERTNDKGGADFQFDAGDLHKDLTVAAAAYVTDDSPDKVKEFYQSRFPSWKTSWKNEEVEIGTKEGNRIRSIAIKREGDHTRIGVASVGPPAAN